MNSVFGEIFMFLTDLAWKSRISIPMLVITAFLIMDVRLQIEVNIQSGQVATDDLDHVQGDGEQQNEQDSDDETEFEEYTTNSQDGSIDIDGSIIDSDYEFDSNVTNQIRISVGLS